MKPRDGWVWSSLGDLYQTQGTSKFSGHANTCYKQAAKLTGKLSPFVSTWHFLGPFVIGKNEVDGDPVAAVGGIREVAKTRLKKGIKYASELVVNGEVGWTTYRMKSAGQGVRVQPQINWNELVNSLGSTAITEWQGWLVGELAVNENNQQVLIQCLGVHTVYVGETPLTGDVYRRDNFWFSVHLFKGIHTVYVRLRTKVSADVKCSIQLAASTFVILEPHYLPDLYDGYLFAGHIALPIANYQSSKWLKGIKVSLTSQEDGSPLTIQQLEDKNFAIAPGQIRPVNLRLQSDSPQILTICSNLKIKIKVSAGGVDLVYPLSLRCRRQRQSFLFTFVDPDGSVQHAAAVAPILGCELNLCPVVVTQHGTTVPPQNQADSYKRMQAGDFVFGVDHAWLLAPTR